MTAAPLKIPVGIPSQLLERRPDVAAAERNMASANALIGIARAAYYPTVSLSAIGGVESSTLQSLLQWSSRFWSLGGSISETLFDAGLRRATVNQYIATYNAEVASLSADRAHGLPTSRGLPGCRAYIVTADPAESPSSRVSAGLFEAGNGTI